MTPEMLAMPGFCYGLRQVDADSAQVVALQNGVRGYYPVEGAQTLPNEMAQNYCDIQNERLGVTKMVAYCMLVGSMFGWDAPGANPRWVMENHPSKSDSDDDLKWLTWGVC